MAFLLDTNVAIHLRDGDIVTIARIEKLPLLPILSVISRVELEGGVYSRPDLSEKRRVAVDLMFARLVVLDFDSASAKVYGGIIAAIGFSRRKLVDRMIAATAIVHNLTLITMNSDDFTDVPGLKIESW